VDRKEGAEIAIREGQVINPNVNPNMLFSEDLY
jgi:hypothetical protein